MKFHLEIFNPISNASNLRSGEQYLLRKNGAKSKTDIRNILEAELSAGVVLIRQDSLMIRASPPLITLTVEKKQTVFCISEAGLIVCTFHYHQAAFQRSTVFRIAVSLEFFDGPLVPPHKKKPNHHAVSYDHDIFREIRFSKSRCIVSRNDETLS